jgi:uncharacterized phage infection (PIP) family protein YhgE
MKPGEGSVNTKG